MAESTMGAAVTVLGTASCMFALLMTSQFAPAIAQETKRKFAQQYDNAITARVSSPTKADACSSSVDKAYNLCMLQGLYNITRVTCECTQGEVPGLSTWDCTGVAVCQK
jgi:hypothetical protein